MTKKIIKKNKSFAKKKTKTSSVSKTDFETFKFGVERLKELEKELKSLDTRGFSIDEQDIKERLKKVSEIPNIERKLKALKLKINKKYKPKKRKSPVKEIKKSLEDIQEELKGIKKSRKKSPVKEIKENLEEIHGELEGIKKSRKTVKPDLGGIKEELRKIRREHKEEIKLNKPDLGEIQEQLKKIEKAHEKDSEAIKKSSAKQRIPIDDDVDVLVDTKFSSFLNEIKKALSERVDKKEREIDKQSEIDLQEREFKYRKKHDELLSDFESEKGKLEKEQKKVLSELINKKLNLEKKDKELIKKLEAEYHRKFDDKIKESLAQEVSVKFREKLDAKFEQEKTRIDGEYKSELKKHARAELENQKQKLEEKARNKEQSLKNQEEIEVKQIREKLISESHRELEAELAKKERELKARLENDYELKIKQKIHEHEEEIKRRKLDLELEMQKKIKQVLA